MRRKKILTCPDKDILILGIGNILMGDEGIGSRVAQFISKNELPEGIQCIDGGTGGFHLLAHLEKASKIFIIDATVDDQTPGTITRLTPHFSNEYPRTLTAHDIGLKDMIDSFHLLGKVPEIILYAISINPINEVSLELSPQIEKIIPDVSQKIFRDISIIKSNKANSSAMEGTV